MNILITCCLGDHLRSNVDDIRKAYPGCRIVGVDMRQMFFNHNGLDKFYKVSRCDDPKYVKEIIDICKKEDIDIIISFSSLDIAPFRDNKQEFDELGIKVAIGCNGGTVLANDKVNFCGICWGEAIIPRWHIVTNSRELGEWMRHNHISKAVTKTRDSTGAKGMNIYNIDELEDFAFSEPVLAQEYLSGAEYSVDLFCKHGQIAFGCVKKNYDMDLGVSIYSEIVDRPDIIDICAPACKLFKLDGLVGFDLKEDDMGNVYILECNPRPTATISLVSKAGVNLLAHLIEYYMTGDTVFNESIDYGLKIARFREDYYFKEDPEEWKL